MTVTQTFSLRLSDQAKIVFKAIPVLLAWGLITEDEADRIIWNFVNAFELEEIREGGKPS